jgi:hypothetical protein
VATPRSQLELEQGDEGLRQAGIRDAGAGLTRFASRALMLADEIGTPGSGNPYELGRSAENLVASLSDKQCLALAADSPTVWRWRVKGVSKHRNDAENARARLVHLVKRVITCEWRRQDAAWEPLADAD